MWSTTWFAEAEKLRLDESNAFFFSRVSFHMCMHGGQRPKLTDFIFNGLDLSTLEAQRDGLHTHLPWGMLTDGSASFATALERNYPQKLCQRVAKRAALAYGAQQTKKHLENPDKAEHLEIQPRRSQRELAGLPFLRN